MHKNQYTCDFCGTVWYTEDTLQRSLQISVSRWDETGSPADEDVTELDLCEVCDSSMYSSIGIVELLGKLTSGKLQITVSPQTSPQSSDGEDQQ